MAMVAGWRANPRSADGVCSACRSCILAPHALALRFLPVSQSSAHRGLTHLVYWTQAFGAPIYMHVRRASFERPQGRRGKPAFCAGRALRQGRRQCRGGGGARCGPAAARHWARTITKNAAALAAALGGLKGPIMKVAQLHGHHPGGAAGGIRAGAFPAAVAGAADGAGVRAAAHDGRTRAGVGCAIQEFRAATGSIRVAGTGASRRRPRRPRAGGQAAVSRHAVGGGGGPQPAQGRVRAACAHEPGRGHGRDPQGSVGAAARGTRLRAGSSPHGAVRADLPGRAAHSRAGGAGGPVDQAPADHDLARGPQAARLQGRRRWRIATPSRRRCSRRGGIRSRTTA